MSLASAREVTKTSTESVNSYSASLARRASFESPISSAILDEDVEEASNMDVGLRICHRILEPEDNPMTPDDVLHSGNEEPGRWREVSRKVHDFSNTLDEGPRSCLSYEKKIRTCRPLYRCHDPFRCRVKWRFRLQRC